jgi:CRP/FNR family transcriptional regulator, cyclic AMP receptor protein
MSAADAARIPVFAALKSRDRDKVLGNATQRTYAPGATLVAEGEVSVNLFFIASGRARVTVAGEGQRAMLGPGDFFGELGLIERHPRTASVIAEDEITCVMVPAWEFRGLLEEHPEMAVPMVYGLVSRLHGLAHHEHGGGHAPE